jgi:hypothetical protein
MSGSHERVPLEPRSDSGCGAARHRNLEGDAPFEVPPWMKLLLSFPMYILLLEHHNQDQRSADDRCL